MATGRLRQLWKYSSRPWIPALILLLGISVSAVLAFYEQQATTAKHHDLATQQLSRLIAQIEQAIHDRLSVLTALEAFVHSHGGGGLAHPQRESEFRGAFRRYVESLERQVDGILSMQLAPGAVVTYMSNEVRNRQALGHDLLVDDSRREQVLDTIVKRALIMAGPLELIQGGEAIIARRALFMTPGTFDADHHVAAGRVAADSPWLQDIPGDFWGLATVLIETGPLYREAGLDTLNAKGDRFSFALRGRHGLGANGEVFWGDPTVFEAPLASAPVIHPGGQWILAARDNRGLVSPTALILFFIGVTGSILLSYALLLSEAREQAQARSRAKSEFLSTMSHELRTPMNAILGFTQVLQHDTDLNNDQRESINEIEKAGQHLLTLINDVLDLVKIETGRLDLNLQPVAVSDIVSECLNLLVPAAEQRGISMQPGNARHHSVQADPVRVKQVLLNLLSNAVKYNRDGGSVAIEYAVPAPDRLRVTVVDTGYGLSKAEMAQLFQPFSRPGRRNAEVEGTGIGLIIARNLIEQMGGQINVDSREGIGSRFWFELPQAVDRMRLRQKA